MAQLVKQDHILQRKLETYEEIIYLSMKPDKIKINREKILEIEVLFL